MTQEAYRKTAEDVVYLAACAVNGVSPDADRVRGMELSPLYQVAERHQLTALTAAALEAAGVRDPGFTQAKSKAIRKAVLMDAEAREVCARLEAAGIWYMPLKGSVLKDLYPGIGLRQMADRDILIDPARAGDVKEIMESLGFRAERVGTYNHDKYHKEPVCNFEMHRALFDERFNPELTAYYRNVADRLLPVSRWERRFTPEDFYLYLIAHEYKHYERSGTGLRSLLDTWVYLRSAALDMAYVSAEAEKLGLAAFEAANRSLSQHLFGGEPLTADEDTMLDYILSSGVYGTKAHQVKSTIKDRHWTKLRYAIHRFLGPLSRKEPEYDAYAAVYPFFYRHKLLLPLLPFYRVFRALRNGRFRAEAKTIRDA